jgi:tetratricopeptide (TPR) repeat protein
MNNHKLNIFLSYGHDHNAELVEMIKNDLEKRGHDVWFDKSEIKTGDDWRRSISDGLTNSDKVLSFLSKYSTRDPGVCRDEIAIAIGVKGGNIQTILVESETEVKPPVNIGHIQWLDMHNWKELYEQGDAVWKNWYDEKLAEIIRVVESDESKRFAGEIENLAEYLQPIQSHARINELVNRGFFGREWLFRKLEDWRSVYSNSSRVFVLLAGAGVGKSAFAARLAHLRGDVLVAAHFCEWNKPTHSDARATVKSIAFQLATKFPDYRKYLLTLPGIDKLEQQSAAELFSYLVANPLSFCIDGGRQRYMILIDAVDEANTENNQNELISLIDNEFHRTPHWLSLVVTSRPENEVLAQLNKFNPKYIDAAAEENTADIQLFLQERLSDYDPAVRKKAIESILNKCKGNFLYAVEICNDIHNKGIDINHPEQFPAGMANLFLNSFNRKFAGTDYNTKIAPVLEILISAMEPISINHVCKLLDMKKRELNEVLLKAGSFFPVNDGKIKQFHKSLIDWLGNTQASERFYIDPEDAEKSMAEAHYRLLEKRFDEPETLEDADEYAIRFALVHLYKAGNMKDLQECILQIIKCNFVLSDNRMFAFLIAYLINNVEEKTEKTFKKIVNIISNKNKYKSGLAQTLLNYLYRYCMMTNPNNWSLYLSNVIVFISEQVYSEDPKNEDNNNILYAVYMFQLFFYLSLGENQKAQDLFEKASTYLDEILIKDELQSIISGYQTEWSINATIFIWLKIIKGLRNDLNNELAILNEFSIKFEVKAVLDLNIHKKIEILEEILVFTQKLVEYDDIFTLNHLSIFKPLINGYREIEQKNKSLETLIKFVDFIEIIISKGSDRTGFYWELSNAYFDIAILQKDIGEVQNIIEYIEKSLKVMEELVDIKPDRNEFRRELSLKFNNVGKIYSDMGQVSKALEYQKNSLKVIEELVILEPDRMDFRKDLSISFRNVGFIYRDMGQGPKALVFFEKSLKVMEELVALESDRTDLRRELSVSFNNVGNIYKAMGQNLKALEFFEKSLKVMEELVALEPDRTDFRRDLSVTFSFLGSIYSDMGEYQKALEFYKKNNITLSELVALEPNMTDFSRDLSTGFNNIGSIYSDMGEYQKALEFYEKSNKISEELVDLEPNITDFRRKLSVGFNNIGSIYKKRGQESKALEFYEKSLKIMEELVAFEPYRTDFRKDLSSRLDNIGDFYNTLGKGLKALEFFEKSMKVLEELVALEPDRTDFRKNLGSSIVCIY